MIFNQSKKNILTFLVIGFTGIFSFNFADASSTHQHSEHASHMAHANNANMLDKKSASTLEYSAVNDAMHQAMAIEFTGNADIDFLKGMIPHHQGAVDMAKIVLKHGKDAKTKRLAKQIIKTQQQEIAQMQQWLKAMEHPAK